MPSISLAVSLRGQLLSGTRIFDPATLFSAGEPGVWYDPSDVANLNWRRNLLTWTEQFDNAAWSKTNLTVTANNSTAPDGQVTADLFAETTATGEHNTAVSTLSVTSGTSYTASFYAKYTSRQYIIFRSNIGATGSSNFANSAFDVQNGNVFSSGSGHTCSITSIGNGWYRCVVTMTPTWSGATGVFAIGMTTNGTTFSYTGDAANTILIWGAQLELGSVATDYQRITDVNTEIVERFPNATLYQDTIGTIPVTGPTNLAGNPSTVALMLDKSRGLALGAELVVNGDFSGGSTGWSLGAGWAVTGGAAVFSGNATGTDLVSTVGLPVIGKTYRVTVTQAWTSGGQARAIYGGVFFDIPAASGTYTFFMTASASAEDKFRFRALVGASVFSLDNISVRELPGNHATQGTAASRPIYGVVPQGGRRNLLLWSEDYSNAVWIAGTGASKSASKITNTSTTNVFVYQQVSGLPLSRFTASVDFKKDTARYAQLTLGYSTGNLRYAVLLDLDTGLFVEDANTATALTEKSYSISSVVDGWYRISISGTGAAGVGFLVVSGTNSLPVTRNADLDFTNATNGVAVNVRKADLRPASDLGNYQRVTTQYDVTEAGVKSLSYLSFDGADDFMGTTVDTNTIFGVAGSDPGYMIVGGANYNTAGGTAVAFARAAFLGDTGGYIGMWAYTVNGGEAGIYQWDTSEKTAARAYTIGSSAVFTGKRNPLEGVAGKIYASVNGISSAGTDVAALSAVSGTLQVGRQFTGGYINGQVFGIVARGAASTPAQINATEYWLNEKTGAF
jgi:hypothetical protein